MFVPCVHVRGRGRAGCPKHMRAEELVEWVCALDLLFEVVVQQADHEHSKARHGTVFRTEMRFPPPTRSYLHVESMYAWGFV